MAKSVVAKMECDRCGVVWYVDYLESEGLPDAPGMSVHLQVPGDPAQDMKGSFEVLCPKCTQAVRNYLSSVLKVPKEETEAKKEEPKPAKPPPRRSKRQGEDLTWKDGEPADVEVDVS